MINTTPMLRKDNPRWPIGNARETAKVPGLSLPAPPVPAAAQRQAATPAIGVTSGIAAAGDAIRRTAGIVVAWLTGLPRRAGRRLFAMNDLEARWRGWQVTELSGGLRRQYRDLRFLQAIPGERPPAPPVPEAWDDHWDGRGLGSGKDEVPGSPLDGDD
jgi:hypothetical protein